MSYYPDPGSDAHDRLREEAKHDTELALERERLQNKEREEQHAATLKIELRKREEELHRAQRDLGAIELERDHLEHTKTVGRRATIGPELPRAVEREKNEIRNLETKERTLDTEEERVRRELALKERTSEGVSHTAVRTLTDELARKEQDMRELEQEIRELKHRIETEEEGGEAGRRENQEEKRVLTRKLEELREKERDIKDALTRHKRELERAEQQLKAAEHETEAAEDTERTAGLRLREKEEKARALERTIRDLEQKIEALKRQLT